MYPFYTEAALKSVSIAADLFLANFKVLCFPIEARISKWHSCFYGVGSESEECGKPMKCSRRYPSLPFFSIFPHSNEEMSNMRYFQEVIFEMAFY